MVVVLLVKLKMALHVLVMDLEAVKKIVMMIGKDFYLVMILQTVVLIVKYKMDMNAQEGKDVQRHVEAVLI